jgi:very-short-patch-repair endonuclease
MAAVRASPRGAVLSHWSAAALWMIRPNARETIDVTVAHRSRSSALIRRHVSSVPPDERTVREGIPVTSVPRTVLDLAATESDDVVDSILAEVEFQEHRDRLSLPDLLERYPARRGVRKVRGALRRLEEGPPGRRRSKLEERFVPFLRRHRLPLPRLNDWIIFGTNRFQVDCHWPDARLIVELDSWKAHGTRSSFQSDRRRDRLLHAIGYTVIHLTWAQLDAEPQEIATNLRIFLKLKF